VTATDQDKGNNVVLFSTETSFDYEMNQAFTVEVTAWAEG